MDLPVVPTRDGYPLEHGAEYRFIATVPGVALPTVEEIAASAVRAGWGGLLLLWMPGMREPDDFPRQLASDPPWGPLDVLVRAQGTWAGPTGSIATWPLKDDGVSSVHLRAVWRHDSTIPTPPPSPPTPPTPPNTKPTPPKPPQGGGSTPRPGTGPAIVPLGPTGGVVESMGWGFPIAVGLGSALVIYLLLGRR